MRKPFKALLAAILPVTIMFTASFAAACTDDHTHSWSEWTYRDADTHQRVCEGCDELQTAPHVDADSNGQCDDCGWAMTTDVPVSSITVTAAGGATSLEVGDTLQLTATTNSDATNKNVTWTVTSGGDYASVSSSGLVTGRAAGSVTITATAADGSGVTGTIVLTVTAAQQGVEIAAVAISGDDAITAAEGDADITLTATVTDTDGAAVDDATLVWSSSDPAVATVGESTGVVSIVGEGTATITVTVQGTQISDSVTLTVNAAQEDTTVASIELDEQTLNLTAGGDPFSLTATAKNAAGDTLSGVTFEWSVNTEGQNVVSVADGVVTPLAEGSATVTVTAAGTNISANCAVTVAAAEDPVVYEKVDSVVDFNYIVSTYGTTDIPSEITVGRFTFDAGIDFVTSHSSFSGLGGVFNTGGGRGFEFELRGTRGDNAISFYALNASSTATTNNATLYVWDETAGDWTPVDGCSASTISSSGYVTVNWENLPAGQYRIESGSSVRFAGVTLTEWLPESEATGISVSGAQTEFLVGDGFVTTGLNVTLNYENGRQDVLSASQYSVTAPAINGAGTYQVTVSFTPDGAAQPLTATYDIDVYQIDSLAVYDFVLDADSVTQPLQKVFLTNGEFNSDNLAIQATGSVPGTDKTATFYLSADDYNVTAPDMTTAGEKTVNVQVVAARGTASTSYTINVVDNVFTAPSGTYTIAVDANGAVSVESAESVTFTSINDALKYFEITGVNDQAAKVINVAAGTYNEKVEVTIPNVSIIGAGESASAAVVVFDALNGLLDPSGTVTYGTDGSATISIRDTATGFYAENITFQNYYNTNALYEQSQLLTPNTQAVATLIEAEEATFYNVRFSSYHDTLYARTGTFYFYQCYIEGRTDYIFGNSATAYFEDCDIHSIGAGVDVSNGGYVVALQPNGTDDRFVFNNCAFDGDENVKPGSVAIGRAWGADMKLVIMNSTFTGAFSTAEHTTGTSQAQRYCSMSSGGRLNDPNPAFILEYNNTGDGAVTAEAYAAGTYATTTFTMLTEEQANAYTTPINVFGTWDPVVWGNITETPVESVEIQRDGAAVSDTIAMVTNDATSGSVTLTAVITPTGATNQKVAWYSSDEEVATVDANGVVTAVGAGEATISVYTHDNSFTDSVNVSVTAGQALVQEYTITASTGNVSNGGTFTTGNLFTATNATYDPTGNNGSGGSMSLQQLTSTVTAGDGSGRTFDYVLQAGGGRRAISLTASRDMTLTIYYTVTNSSSLNTSGTRSANLTWSINDGAFVTSTNTAGKAGNVAYAETITLNSGDTVLIGITNTDRLTLFGLYATEIL